VSEGNAPLRCRVIVHVGADAHGQPCETFAGLGAVPWAERAAQELRLSHRTVGAHLYHIFPQLGISSRDHLTAVFATGHRARESGLQDAGF
jgi:hypothetical protein